MLMGTTTARKNGSGNPSCIDKGDPVIQGTNAKNMHNNSVGYDCHANMKETNADSRGLGSKFQQIGQINTELNADIDKGLSFPKTDKGQTDNTLPLLQHRT